MYTHCNLESQSESRVLRSGTKIQTWNDALEKIDFRGKLGRSARLWKPQIDNNPIQTDSSSQIVRKNFIKLSA